MRRLLAIAAMAAVVLTGAACNKSDTPTTTPTTAAPTSAAGNAANAAVCDAAKKATTDAVTAFTTQMATIQDAIIKGDTTAEAAAVKGFKDFLTSWSASMQATADSAADPEFKATLAAVATAVGDSAGKINSIDDIKNAETLMNSPALVDAGTKLAKICPGT
jgi:hypothetical protein